MNKVLMVGRLTKDPEVRVNGEHTVARFTVAVDRRVKSDDGPSADFISCVAFGKTAEFIEKYFSKGNRIGVEGRIQTGSYTDKNGNKVYTTDVFVEQVEFTESKSTAASNVSNDSPDGFMEMGDEEELPFN